MRSMIERFNELAKKNKNSLRDGEEKQNNASSDSERDCEKIASKNKAEETLLYLPASKKIQTPVPNIVLRSCLFGVVGKGMRKFQKNILKVTLNGYTVKYTGEQLDQADLDVWLECLRRCQECPLENIVRFSSYDFLKSIDRTTGKSQYNWLNDSLNRMKVSGVHLSDGKYTYVGSLIDEIYRDEEKYENCLVLNSKIAACFGDSCWTGITKSLRLQLKGKPLTQWLYGFYSSHAKPLPIKIETLRDLCGSEISELRMFRFKLKKAIVELSSVTGWSCEIDEKDKLIVRRK